MVEHRTLSRIKTWSGRKPSISIFEHQSKSVAAAATPTHPFLRRPMADAFHRPRRSGVWSVRVWRMAMGHGTPVHRGRLTELVYSCLFCSLSVGKTPAVWFSTAIEWHMYHHVLVSSCISVLLTGQPRSIPATTIDVRFCRLKDIVGWRSLD